MKVSDLLKHTVRGLEETVDDAHSEAYILLGYFLDKDKLWLITHADFDVIEFNDFDLLLQRRQRHEPIEYITNRVEFYSETFFIDYGALIPRPETEILVEKVLDKLDSDFSGHIVEIGVGSGIITTVLALNLPKARFTAVDISDDALAIAKVNIENFGLANRVLLLKSDLLSEVETKIDVLVSNPPYIEEGVVLGENLSFEPQNALFGGRVGDEILKRIIDSCAQKKIGLVACEMGYDQKKSLGDYVEDQGLYKIEFYKDLASLDRGFVMELQ